MTEKGREKVKKRTWKLLSSFVVLTIVLSVLAVSVTSVSAQPPPPKPTEIVVTANPSSIPAVAGSTSTITATVINWTGAGPGGLMVCFEIEGHDYGTSISPEQNMTDGDGKAYATLTAGTGVELGTVTVKATGEGGIAVDTTQVTLSGAPEVTSIVVSPSEKTLIVDGTQQFTATAYSQYDVEMPDVEFTWESSNETVGTVSETGFFEALALGSTFVNATNASIVGSASVTVTMYAPDLIVTEIMPNCDEIFGNESNEVCATIKNNGTAAAGAFNVSFAVDGFSEEVRIAAGLAAGANTTRCVTDPTLRNAGDLVTITVTADCDGEVIELNEANNATVQAETVVNNGYKGKTYTGGENITTLQTHTLNGSVLYSVGDSYYLSGATGWTTYTANWTASDLPVPGAATIEKARLYVIYTWDKVQGMPDNVSMTFNDNLKTRDAFYTDRKGYGSWDYPCGMLAYDVTGDFNTSGNTAVLGNLNPVAGNPSIRGMLLVVIYADDSEPQRTIFVNEGFDLLYGGSGKCTTPEEATAFAPFAGAIEDIGNKSARLITVAPGADPNEGELIFNGNVWTDVWNFAGATQIGIDDRYVTSHLLAEDNEAAFQSSGDYMEASNAILVVEKVPPVKNFTIDFVTGYNMISMPLNDTSVTNASTLIDKIGANCTEIFKWNTTTQGWESYNPGMPPAAAFNIVGGEGYFVSMSGPETVVFRGKGWESPFAMSLVTGYNMIGIPVNDTSVTNASLLIAKIGANCTEIFKWNKTSQGWESYNPSMPPAAAFDIGCGEGYFVSMAGPADVAFEGEPCQD